MAYQDGIDWLYQGPETRLVTYHWWNRNYGRKAMHLGDQFRAYADEWRIEDFRPDHFFVRRVSFSRTTISRRGGSNERVSRRTEGSPALLKI